MVPSANCGGSPAANKAGTVISPPPPAMVSTKPAKNAAAVRRIMLRVETSMMLVSNGNSKPLYAIALVFIVPSAGHFSY